MIPPAVPPLELSRVARRAVPLRYRALPPTGLHLLHARPAIFLDLSEEVFIAMLTFLDFDTFFVFGPEMVTPDEIDDVMSLNVSTLVNSEVKAANQVMNMTYPPDYLVALHSTVMTQLPGDILSTGTPGASHIQDGDRIECRIDGFESLACPVQDLKSASPGIE